MRRNNASAVVLKGEDLASIADSPEDMLSDLQALAGPSAGPSGGSVYVDGFSNGDLPGEGIDSRNPHQSESVLAGI